jgi:hypothetical protein
VRKRNFRHFSAFKSIYLAERLDVIPTARTTGAARERKGRRRCRALSIKVAVKSLQIFVLLESRPQLVLFFFFSILTCHLLCPLQHAKG